MQSGPPAGFSRWSCVSCEKKELPVERKEKMRKTVLYIGMSLDGYIADPNGGVGWMNGQEESAENGDSYENFIKTVDTVIMGWNTYHQVTTELSVGEWVYEGLTTWVITHRTAEEGEKATESPILFTDRSPCDLVKSLKKEEGKNIWICGGADIVRQLMEEDLIDVYHVSILPTLLGDGIRLFQTLEKGKKLRLIRTESENGRVVRYVAGHEPECVGEEVAVKAETLRYKSVRAGERLRMKLRGATYFDAASARNYGSLMHEVLSGIVSAEDMDKRIGQFVSDGEISAEEGRKLASLINAHLSDERVKGWFDGKATVLRETSILQPGSQVMRPDRIVIGNGKVSVIDYKFGAERGEHRKQMQNYLSLVRRMGYFDVKGYLWYLSEGRIVEIE